MIAAKDLYITINHPKSEVVESYEIEFIGSRWAADILMEALRIGKLQVEIEITENGFKCKMPGRVKRKIIIACHNMPANGCIAIVNAKESGNGKIAINADAIAKKLGSTVEMAMLGILARFGVVELHHIMAAAYKHGYVHALAAKRGYDSFKLKI